MSGEADGGPALTKRQHECLALAAIGKSEAEIAALLALAPATVHFHIEEAKKRLGARSRAEAIGLMVLRGLL
jgi:DNA-binding CsgD family transcriptional regulator